MKRNPTEWEKIFVNYSSDSGFTSKMYKEPKQKVKTNDHSEVGLGYEQRIFKRTVRKYLLKCSSLGAIGKQKSKQL